MPPLTLAMSSKKKMVRPIALPSALDRRIFTGALGAFPSLLLGRVSTCLSMLVASLDRCAASDPRFARLV